MEFLTEYLNMWKNFANFSDRTTVRGYWMAALVNFIAEAVLGIISRNILVPIYSLAIIVPFLSISVRRLRDAGKEWTNVFWVLLPIVGWVIVILYLCKPSIPDNNIPVV